MKPAVASAYSFAGAAWRAGPAAIYDRLAKVLVDRCPLDLAASRALDVGAGTGAASRALAERGASVVAVDLAPGMLAAGGTCAAHPVVADAVALPFPAGVFDVAVAAFSLNHLPEPAAGFREAARVTRPGGWLVVGAYAEDDTHPVKVATEEAAAALGWRAPSWYRWLRGETVPRLATVEAATAAAASAGLAATVERIDVSFPDLAPADLVAWRLGMPYLAAFVAGLNPGGRARLVADARLRLGTGPPPLVRRLVVTVAETVPRPSAEHLGDERGGR